MMKKKKKLSEILYNGLQWTWGLPQTLAGAGLYLKHRKDPHFDYKGACVTAWGRDSGISLGKFIFVPGKKGCRSLQHKAGWRPDAKNPKRKAGEDSVSSFLLDHEYGHTIQSLLLGPTYLLVVGLPSILWNRLPYFRRKRQKTGRSYYSAVFERTANELGARTSDKDK